MPAALTTAPADALGSPLFLALTAAAFIVLMILSRVNKKRKAKKAQAAYDGIMLGNSVVLINGMTGTVRAIAGDVIEVELTGTSRARFMKWAVSEIDGKKIA